MAAGKSRYKITLDKCKGLESQGYYYTRLIIIIPQ